MVTKPVFLEDLSTSAGELLRDTDLANAKRFRGDHCDNVKYTPERGWLVWNGKRWKVDDQGAVTELAKQTVLSIYDEIKDSSNKAELFRWARRSQSARSINDLLTLAKSDPSMTSRLRYFDSDPWLLNCRNGIVNLKTAELRPHDRRQLQRRMAPVDYSRNAQCPRWLRFLSEIFDNNKSLINFIQRVVGYSLTGSTREQCLFFCYGYGANGKTVFLETLQTLLGNYALNSRTESIMVRRNAGIPNDIARFAGARFVTMNETGEGQRLNESLIKDLTGGDTITARFLHREYFDFRPCFKLFLRGNHKPLIRGTDHGIWRRMRLIPFGVTIPEKDQDPNLITVLKAELPGILVWAIEGCQTWQQSGLNEPAIVAQAVSEYRDEMDTLGQFLNDCCLMQPQCKVMAKRLYGAYREWCGSSGQYVMNLTRFGMAIVERNITKHRTNDGYIYEGIGLVVPDDEVIESEV